MNAELVVMKKIFVIFSNIFVITAVIYFSVSILYEVVTAKFDQVHLPKPSQKQVLSSTGEIFQPLSYYKRIIERDLFNVEEKPGQNLENLDTEELPETDLKLKLWGTVIGGVDKAYAVIEETTSRKQNLYREGEAIQRAIVKRILRKKVILSLDGRNEILSMEISPGGKAESGFGALERESEPTHTGDTQDIAIKRSKIDRAIE
jgi:general secretion pathway protein C